MCVSAIDAMKAAGAVSRAKVRPRAKVAVSYPMFLIGSCSSLNVVRGRVPPVSSLSVSNMYLSKRPAPRIVADVGTVLSR